MMLLLLLLLLLVSGCGRHGVRGLFGLTDGHRSAALEGQYRDREPQEKTEEQTHGTQMVPQIKNVYQGMPQVPRQGRIRATRPACTIAYRTSLRFRVE